MFYIVGLKQTHCLNTVLEKSGVYITCNDSLLYLAVVAYLELYINHEGEGDGVGGIKGIKGTTCSM